MNGDKTMQILHPAFHEKKILPQYFKDVKEGRKNFELRKDDCDYQIGDLIQLQEWNYGTYTGETITKEIAYILRDCPEYGLAPGFCILGLKEA